MKAIIEKDTYKITGERGDFFITENNKGKVKMFAKASVTVIEISEMPSVKVYKQSVLKADKDYSNLFNDRLHTALTAETGRIGSLEFLKSL